VTDKWTRALAVAAAVVALDQLTKAIVVRSMELHQSIPVIDGLFSLTYVRNTGAAFGLMAGRLGPEARAAFFLTVSAVAMAVLGWFLRGVPAERRLVVAACGAVLGGAVGNMIDRATLGEVVDFLDLHVRGWHWPAFNVADMAITVGVAVLCLDALRRPAEARAAS
jgi:signal peptidase II